MAEMHRTITLDGRSVEDAREELERGKPLREIRTTITVSTGQTIEIVQAFDPPLYVPFT